MTSPVKSLLSEIRADEGVPSVRQRLRLFLRYQEADSPSGWSMYPEIAHQPRFLNPSVRSELLVFDHSETNLLRCASALARSHDNRGDLFRTLVVPESLEPLATLVDGVSRVVGVPTSGSPETVLNSIDDALETQSFERILHLSTRPGWTWLTEVIRERVEHEVFEGVGIHRFRPTVYGGPTINYILSRELSDGSSANPPVRHGALEGLLFGVTRHDPTGGLSLPDEVVQSARDFRGGLRNADRPLVVLAPPRDGDEQTALRWSQLARHLLNEGERCVVFFGQPRQYDFHEQIEGKRPDPIPFVDRWLKGLVSKAGLLGEADGVVSGRDRVSLVARRLSRPAVDLGPGDVHDVLPAGDLRINTETGWPDTQRLGSVVTQVFDRSFEAVDELGCNVIWENQSDVAAMVREPRQIPPAPGEPDELREFVKILFGYQLLFVLNQMVGVKMTDLTRNRVRERIGQRFGNGRLGATEHDLFGTVRERIRSLEQTLAPSVQGRDPSPPDSLDDRDRRWFRLMEPLWRFRSAADTEDRRNKVTWAIRYLFNGMRRVLQYVEDA